MLVSVTFLLKTIQGLPISFRVRNKTLRKVYKVLHRMWCALSLSSPPPTHTYTHNTLNTCLILFPLTPYSSPATLVSASPQTCKPFSASGLCTYTYPHGSSLCLLLCLCSEVTLSVRPSSLLPICISSPHTSFLSLQTLKNHLNILLV